MATLLYRRQGSGIDVPNLRCFMTSLPPDTTMHRVEGLSMRGGDDVSCGGLGSVLRPLQHPSWLHQGHCMHVPVLQGHAGLPITVTGVVCQNHITDDPLLHLYVATARQHSCIHVMSVTVIAVRDVHVKAVTHVSSVLHIPCEWAVCMAHDAVRCSCRVLASRV